MDCPPVKSENDYLIPPTSNMIFFHRPEGGARSLSLASGESLDILFGVSVSLSASQCP